MMLLAIPRLGFALYLLIGEPGDDGAVDLWNRYVELALWVSGHPGYAEFPHIMYPPASQALIWPLLRWPSFDAVRWLWALLSLGALAWFAAQLLRATTRTRTPERVFIVLTLLTAYPTHVALGNGQFILMVLPALIAGLSLLLGEASWRTDLLGTAFFLLAFVSPSLSIPFFWIVLFAPQRLRPALLLVGGYIVLSFLGALPQPVPLPDLFLDWMTRATRAARWGTERGGYANLHALLYAYGLDLWNRPFSLILLAGLGAWMYVHRHLDVWILIAVTAIIARVWTYHRLYDDLLILLPLIALLLFLERKPFASRTSQLARGLFVLAWLSLLAPSRLLSLPPPWSPIVLGLQLTIWMLLLSFFLWHAWTARKAETIRVPS